VSKQLRYILMVPIEIKVDEAKQLKDVVRRIKDNGPFPESSSFGEHYAMWRVRCDLARLKNVRQGKP
jgi:hypothetical protein